MGLSRPASTRDRRARGDRADSTAMSLFSLGLFLVVVIGPSLSLHARGRCRRFVGLPLALSAALMLMCAAFASLALNEPTEGSRCSSPASGCSTVGRPSASRLAARRPRVVAVRRRRDRRDRLCCDLNHNSSVNDRRSANLIYSEASAGGTCRRRLRRCASSARTLQGHAGRRHPPRGGHLRSGPAASS